MSLYYGSTTNNACAGLSLVTYYVQNPATSVWVDTSSRVFTSNNTSSPLNGGYLSEYISSPGGTKYAVVNSSGYVQTVGTCSGECVVEGTMISTGASTSVAVETLTSGSTVLSNNITDLPNTDDKDILVAWSGSIAGTESTAGVVSNIPFMAGTVWNFNNGLLKTTGTHLHIVKRGSDWRVIPASTVEVGDYFKHQDGSEIEITSISIEGNSSNVYKLNVETDDVYYANGILTHNIK